MQVLVPDGVQITMYTLIKQTIMWMYFFILADNRLGQYISPSLVVPAEYATDSDCTCSTTSLWEHCCTPFSFRDTWRCWIKPDSAASSLRLRVLRSVMRLTFSPELTVFPGITTFFPSGSTITSVVFIPLTPERQKHLLCKATVTEWSRPKSGMGNFSPV